MMCHFWPLLPPLPLHPEQASPRGVQAEPLFLAACYRFAVQAVNTMSPKHRCNSACHMACMPVADCCICILIIQLHRM